MRIDTSSSANVSPFTKEEVIEATKCSNFNNAMGLDCFDGNVMRNHKQLEDKIYNEIAIALNDAAIPAYLRVGRLVLLQKT